MKTILFVSTYAPNPKLGGVERVTDLLAKEFIQKGYKIFYLALKKRKKDDIFDSPAPLDYFPKSTPRAKVNFTFYHDYLLKNKVDVIINQSALHHSRCRLFLNHGIPHIKSISTIHNLPMLEEGMMMGKIAALKYQTIVNRICNLALFAGLKLIQGYYRHKRKKHYQYLQEKGSAICVLSPEYIEDMCVTCGIPPEKVFAISNPLSFHVPPFSQEFSLDSKKKQLLFVGRFSSTQKRPEIILKIWSRIYQQFPDWELVFVGDGRARKSLEQRAADLERVRFVGFQNSEPFYKESSIFCMTSPYEGLPMVLIEAQSYGVVPIAFHSFASVTDIIKDGENGLLVKPFDVHSYENKLKELMENDKARQEMARNAMEYALQFDATKIANEWIEHINRLCD